MGVINAIALIAERNVDVNLSAIAIFQYGNIVRTSISRSQIKL